MAKVELKKGDRVVTEGCNLDQYKKVVELMIKDGAKDAYDNISNRIVPSSVGWLHNDIVCPASTEGFYHRQLTVAQVLGEQEMPEVGTLWVNPDNEELTLEVVGYHDGSVICWDGDVSYDPYDPSELTVPAKSHRDKAVEEMMAVVEEVGGSECCDALMGRLFDAGYRKVEA